MQKLALSNTLENEHTNQLETRKNETMFMLSAKTTIGQFGCK